MVETRRDRKRAEDVGEQQRDGLQAGLAWEAGASDPEGSASHRFPRGLVRSPLHWYRVLQSLAPAAECPVH